MAHRPVRKICHMCGMEIGSKRQAPYLCDDHRKQVRMTERQREFLEAIKHGEESDYVFAWRHEAGPNFKRAYAQVVESLRSRFLITETSGAAQNFAITSDGERALIYNIKG